MASEQKEEDNKEEFKSLEHVKNYPIVTSLVDTTKNYYFESKETYKVVNYVGNKLEWSLQGGFQWVAPKIQPLVRRKEVKLYFSLLDSQLDKTLVVLDKRVEQLKEVKAAVGERAESLKASSYRFAEGVDQYLKKSAFAGPINAVLDITEKVIERVLPGDDGKTLIASDEEGPLLRATSLSKRVERRVLSRLDKLKQNPAVKFAVEAPLKISKQVVEKTSSTLRQTYQVIFDVAYPSSQASFNAAHRLYQATADTLHKLVPQSINNFAEKSSKTLHELSSTLYRSLGDYITKRKEAPLAPPTTVKGS